MAKNTTKKPEKSTDNAQPVEKKEPVFVANGTVKLGVDTYYAGQTVPATREQLTREIEIGLVTERTEP